MFDIARGWFNECYQEYSDRLLEELPSLPSRVIDVGISSSLPHIMINTQNMRAQYSTLSHCWGGTVTHKLTIETLDSFQHALPFTDLPANFQDAITISRELGIHYLWIDSLCILQDSQDDWIREANNMGNIYQYSSLTISATTASGSNIGILGRSSARELEPAPTTLRVFADDEIEVKIERQDPQEEDLKGLHIDSALMTRGWTLQESVLSPRQLFYGARQIYWKCEHGFQSADGVCARFKAPERTFENYSLLLKTDRSKCYNHITHKNLLLDDYYDLVEEYCARKLTFDSNKLPTFSGLAQRIQSSLEGQ